MQSVVAATRTTSTTYDPVTQQIATLDGPRVDISDITTNDYDPTTGNLIKVTNALGHQTTFSNHDANGRPRTITDPNGLITTFTYHPRGWLTTRTVDGNTTTFEYDNVGQLTKLILPTNAFISYTYDAAHRLTDITDNLGNTIHYTIDPMGNRTKEQTKDSSGNITRVLEREFDQLSQLLLLIGGEGQLSRYAYDLNGNQTALTDPRNTGNNRASAKTLNPLQTDNTSQSLYDALNRLVEVTQLQVAENGTDDVTTLYEYNALDQLVKVTDPNGLATIYTYNALGDLLQLNSPDTGTTTYTYDEAGNRKTQTDARNITTTYSYDALNRLTTVSYPDTSLNVTYTYDENNNHQNGIGRLTSMSDASGITQYSYDKRGNQTAMTTNRGAVILTTAYAYNAADQLTQITYPSGRSVDYAYDAANRINAVTTTDAQGTQTLLSNIDYQPFGPMNSMTYGNNLTNTQSYDLDYRQTSINTSGVLQRNYDFDEASNITDISNSLNTANNQTFLYDGLSRLEDAQGGYGSLGYQYDKTSNRLQKTDNGSTNTYHYPIDSHRLQDINNSERYRYDANGNTTQLPNSDIVTDLTYGDHNRLTQVNGVTYTYNGRGERVIKDNGSATTHYYYDQNGQLLAEVDANGNVDKEYLMLNGQLIALTTGTADGGDQDQDGIPNHQDNCRAVANAAQLDTDNDDFGNRCDADFDNNGTVSFNDLNYLKSVFDTQDPLADIDSNGMVNNDDLDLFKTLFGNPPGPGASVSVTTDNGLYYVHNDHLGTPQVITDDDQTIVWEAEYDPFGKATVTAETVTNNVRFPGQYFDVETGLYYNYFRYYDPSLGRYLTADKLDIVHRANDPSLTVVADTGLISLPMNGAGSFEFEGEKYDYTAAVVSTAGLNHSYGYVNQNPINDVDVNGLNPASAAFAIAMAAAKAMKKQIEKGADFCKSIRCKIENHDAHHRFGFPFNERRKHIQLTCWRRGVKGSTFILRFPY